MSVALDRSLQPSAPSLRADLLVRLLQGAEAVAILSAGFAARRFAGRDAVGQAIQLDNQPYTVAGVLPARFELFQRQPGRCSRSRLRHCVSVR